MVLDVKWEPMHCNETRQYELVQHGVARNTMGWAIVRFAGWGGMIHLGGFVLWFLVYQLRARFLCFNDYGRFNRSFFGLD